MTDIIKPTFEQVIERVTNVPSLPEVVTQVVRMVNDPRSDADQVHAIMVKDTAMAAKILRMVNSVYYGLTEPVHDLEQAIVILGFKTIRSIALSISVINLFQQQDAGFSMKNFWTHSAVLACHRPDLSAQGRPAGPRDRIRRRPAERHRHADRGAARLTRCVRSSPWPANTASPSRSPRARSWTPITPKSVPWLCKKWELEDQITETIGNQFDLDGVARPHAPRRHRPVR